MENLIIEDLSCNSITIRQQPSCIGSAQFVTTPPGADIFIYDDVQNIFIKQSDTSGSTDNPTVISNIPCTNPIRSNAFRLSLPGYIDEEGILFIESGLIYHLNIKMRQSNPPGQMGGLLLFSLTFGAFIFFLSTRKKPNYQHQK